jgi:hypothetical protein
LDLTREKFDVADTGDSQHIGYRSSDRVRTKKVPGVLAITPIGQADDVLAFG